MGTRTGADAPLRPQIAGSAVAEIFELLARPASAEVVNVGVTDGPWPLWFVLDGPGEVNQVERTIVIGSEEPIVVGKATCDRVNDAAVELMRWRQLPAQLDLEPGGDLGIHGCPTVREFHIHPPSAFTTRMRLAWGPVPLAGADTMLPCAA